MYTVVVGVPRYVWPSHDTKVCDTQGQAPQRNHRK